MPGLLLILLLTLGGANHLEAAELGRIRVASGAGDPLQVAIELRDAGGGQFRPTSATIANRSVYAQRGLPYPDDLGPILVDLFWPNNNTAIIRVRASAAATTPSVPLLLDIRWNDGAVTRQLTTIEAPRRPVAVVQGPVPAPPLATPPRPSTAAPVPEWGSPPPARPRPSAPLASLTPTIVAPSPGSAPARGSPGVSTRPRSPQRPPPATNASPAPRPRTVSPATVPAASTPGRPLTGRPPESVAAAPTPSRPTIAERAPGAVADAARLPDLGPAAESATSQNAATGTPSRPRAEAAVRPSPVAPVIATPVLVDQVAAAAPVEPARSEAPADPPTASPAPLPPKAAEADSEAPGAIAPRAAAAASDRLSISRSDLDPSPDESAPAKPARTPMAAGEHQVANEIVQSEARGRIETLNQTLNAMRTLVAYKDEQIARLQQRLRGGGTDALPSLNPGLLPLLEARGQAAPVLATLPVLVPVAGQRLALPAITPGPAPRQGGWIATGIAMAIAALLTLVWIRRYRQRDYRSPGPSHNPILRGVLGQEPNMPHSIFRGNV